MDLFIIESPCIVNATKAIGFEGFEAISQPFHFNLKFLLQDDELDLAQCLSQPIAVTLNDNGFTRNFHGIIKSIKKGSQQAHGWQEYAIQIMPWLKLLDYIYDCRIFKSLSVPQITKLLCNQSGFYDLELQLSDHYEPIDYCVQYNESTFNFISRILQAKGIFYFFRFEKNKHVLVLSDTNNLAIKGPAVIYSSQPDINRQYLFRWRRETQCIAAIYSQTDYLFKMPDQDLMCMAQASYANAFSQNNKLQKFHYPGGYQTLAQGMQSVRIAAEREQARQIQIFASGTYSSFQAGMVFKLIAHSVKMELNDYLLTKVHHHVREKGFLSHASLDAENITPFYWNEFECIPYEIPYRSDNTCSKPSITGYQTAKIVGADDSHTIHTNQYASIKVQFPWAHEMHEDQNISSWIRAAHWWAGNNYGTQFIPRLDQEVLVEFMNGDPDHPVISGAVPNANHHLPYKLPGEAFCSGITTHSSPDDYDAIGNELRFNNKPGEEEILIQAKRDFKQTVQQDEKIEIGHMDNMTINQGSSNCEVAGNFNLETNGRIEYRVGSNYIRLEPDQLIIAGATIRINCKDSNSKDQ